MKMRLLRHSLPLFSSLPQILGEVGGGGGGGAARCQRQKEEKEGRKEERGIFAARQSEKGHG